MFFWLGVLSLHFFVGFVFVQYEKKENTKIPLRVFFVVGFFPVQIIFLMLCFVFVFVFGFPSKGFSFLRNLTS